MSEEGPKSKRCPDCAIELGEEHAMRPITEFYRQKASKYAGGYRYRAYCKRHEMARNNKAMREAQSDSPLKQAKKRAQKKYAERHRERVNANRRRWVRMHPERQAEMYASWVERNRDRRKRSQDAWLERQKLRSKTARIWRRRRAGDLSE